MMYKVVPLGVKKTKKGKQELIISNINDFSFIFVGFFFVIKSSMFTI